MIEPRLYLGNYRSGLAALAGDERPVMPTKRVAPFAGVVSLCPVPLYAHETIPRPRSVHTKWMHVPIADGGNGESEFESALERILPFVFDRMQIGNVVVHCAAGMSRSVSVVAAALCSKGASVDDAFERVARAKSAALAIEGAPTTFIIAPAGEFRAALRRIFR